MHNNNCTSSPARQPSHHLTTQPNQMKTNGFLEPNSKTSAPSIGRLKQRREARHPRNKPWQKQEIQPSRRWRGANTKPACPQEALTHSRKKWLMLPCLTLPLTKKVTKNQDNPCPTTPNPEFTKGKISSTTTIHSQNISASTVKQTVKEQHVCLFPMSRHLPCNSPTSHNPLHLSNGK